MATWVFEGIKLFQDILKRTMAGTFLWNFFKIRWVVSEKKMFKEKVNAWTDALTWGCTTDNGPWHKLAGLLPVQLKPNFIIQIYFFCKCFQPVPQVYILAIWYMVNPFANDKFYSLPHGKSLQMTILNLMKMVEISPTGQKTQWEKDKLLMNNFSFSNSVFKRLVLKTCKNMGLFGKGLSMFIDDY